MTESQLWFAIGASEASPEKLNHLSPAIRRKKRGAEFEAAPAGDDKLAALVAALIDKGTDPKRAKELALEQLRGERQPKTDLVTKIGSFAEDGLFIQHA